MASPRHCGRLPRRRGCGAHAWFARSRKAACVVPHRGNPLPVRTSALAVESRAWPFAVLRTVVVRRWELLVCHMPQSGAVLERRVGPRDRQHGQDPGVAHADIAGRRVVAGTGLGREVPRPGACCVRADDKPGQHEQFRSRGAAPPAGIPGYQQAFAAAFPGRGDQPRSRGRCAGDLRARHRRRPGAIRPLGSRAGRTQSVAAAKQGFDLFNGKAGCAECHRSKLHRRLVPRYRHGNRQTISAGPACFPSSNKLHYAFKAPTLRDVARRAPYMHDGSVPTLEAVIDLYDQGRHRPAEPIGSDPSAWADIPGKIGSDRVSRDADGRRRAASTSRSCRDEGAVYFTSTSSRIVG